LQQLIAAIHVLLQLLQLRTQLVVLALVSLAFLEHTTLDATGCDGAPSHRINEVTDVRVLGVGNLYKSVVSSLDGALLLLGRYGLRVGRLR